ncbi:MAG: DUF1611 domain-containing protein [Kordiimonadaceae bacterium]|nr:DUF1611 domain-containing protein [Kordiimonadaceae bacterium]
MITTEIKPPYLIFFAEKKELKFVKTGIGLFEWRRDLCVGQLGIDGGHLEIELPQMSIKEAHAAGVKSLIIGTTSIGGGLPAQWMDTFIEAANIGMDIVGGLHEQLNDAPDLKKAADKSGAKLIDIRVPPKNIPVGTGKKRSGKRVLMVGTDCAVGKKYTALALERDMLKAGMDVDFRASGQTGIIIAGKGIPIDAVVVDFISGAAEILSPDNADNHYDNIEGQGGIFHPGYSAVSLGLLIGSQPGAFVVCHKAGRQNIGGWDDFPLPSIQQVIDRTTELGKQVNPEIKCVGISVNTEDLSDEERAPYLENLSKKYGLPCIDPIKDGTDAIIANLV